MGQSVTPIAFRLGFYRVWDSLYTNKIYFKNYNFFVKSQIISMYVDGFFKKWTWDGKRSFFLNFLYSHLELSWSHDFLHMYVYVYNTGFEYVLFKLNKNLNKRFFFKSFKEKKIKKFNNLFFLKNKLLNNRDNFVYFTKMRKMFDYFFLPMQKYKDIYKKEKNIKFFFLNKKLYVLKKKIMWKLKNFFSKNFQISKHKILSFDLLNFEFSLDKKKKNQIKTEYFLNIEKNIYIVIYNLYIFFKFLVKMRYFKTFLSFVNYFFLIKPFEASLKRYFVKDFYKLLKFNKVLNFNNRVKISMKRLIPQSLTAAALGKHIWLKLSKKYKFGSVINGIMRSIKNTMLFKGILVRSNGRFTKKQRAWHSVHRYGKVPLSQKSALIDDFIVNVKLRYGMCSVRIYINYKI